MKSRAFCFALLSATAIVVSAPAQAQNGLLTRSFVSSAGVDSNPCTITQPCASFAQAYTKIGASGIIAALDPGKYGPITITGPVTVNGNGWAAITAPAEGIGINVSASSGNVILNGLEIDGAGAAYNGIVFNTGSSLTISNCIVKDFVRANGDFSGQTGNGIWIAPTSGNINFTIVNTIAVNNVFAGIAYLPASGSPTASGAIDHVVATNNADIGIDVNGSLTSGGSAAVSISNSVASNNGQIGIAVLQGPGIVTVTIDNDQISNNNELAGIDVASGTALLSRSVITENSLYGIVNNGTLDTFQNNQIYANGNGNAVLYNPLTPVSQQ
jgi:hypothetical protein